VGGGGGGGGAAPPPPPPPHSVLGAYPTRPENETADEHAPVLGLPVPF
jgi:hypothetical protein